MRLAFVDLARLLDESKEGRAGAEALRRQYEEQQQAAAPLLARAKSSPPLRAQLEELLRRHDGEREALRVQLRQQLMRQIEPVVAKLAQEGGFEVVEARGATVLYVSPGLDLTEKVLALLDA